MAHRSVVMVKRTYLHIAVVSLVTAVLWMIISIYRSLSAPSSVKVDAATLAPLEATLEMETLNQIAGREDLAGLVFEPPVASPASITINEVTPSEESVVAEPTAEPTEASSESVTPE